MMARIIADDIRELAIGELWSTIEEIMDAQGIDWRDLAVRLDWSMSELQSHRVAIKPELLALGYAAKVFAALGYELSLTAALIPRNPLPERKASDER